MKALIFDPVGGASGDMILSSLLDLGCPVEHITGILKKLGLKEAKGRDILSVKNVQKNGISLKSLTFNIDKSPSRERSYKDITALISQADIDSTVKDSALAIFDTLARAEASVHGCSPEDVHFHEVGAADSILDITGIAAAVQWFAPEVCYYLPVPLGSGRTKSRHGVIPVPAPATLSIVQGMQVRFTGIESELTTPTGAAVLKSLCSAERPPSDVIIDSLGCGAGSRDISDWPNMFRTMLCTIPDTSEILYITETDVDDMTPEDWELASARLYEAGAIDVNLTQRTMKRGRPGVGIKAVSTAGRLMEVNKAMLSCTTSIGVRYYQVNRHILERREYTVKTSLGPVHVKESRLPDGTKRIKPEYRDLLALANKTGLSLEGIRKKVMKDIENQ